MTAASIATSSKTGKAVSQVHPTARGRWLDPGRGLQRGDAEVAGIVAGRPFLEHLVRREVAARPQVQFTVAGLEITNGRGRRRSGDPPGRPPGPRAGRSGGRGDRTGFAYSDLVGRGGISPAQSGPGQVPPTDPEGFTAFASDLAAPDVTRAIQGGEPLSDPVLMRFPAEVCQPERTPDPLPGGPASGGGCGLLLQPGLRPGDDLGRAAGVVLRAALARNRLGRVMSLVDPPAAMLQPRLMLRLLRTSGFWTRLPRAGRTGLQ